MSRKFNPRHPDDPGKRGLGGNDIFLRQVLNSAHDSIFAIDLNYHLLLSNECHQQNILASGMSRIAPGESILISDYPPETLAFWRNAYDRAFRGEELQFETEWSDRNDRRYVFENNLSPFRDEDGTIIGALVVAHDITMRKRAEEKLRINEKTLKLFVEYAPAAIAMFDHDMKYIAASHRYLSDYSLQNQSILGRSHYDIFPEIGDRWKEIHQHCLSGRTERCEKEPFPRADGSIDWVRWEIHPWYLNPDEIGGLLLLSEVITERIKAEEKLRASEEKYRSLIECLNSVVATIDYNGKFLFMNDVAARQIGSTPQALIGKTMQEIFPEPVASYQLKGIRQVIDEDRGHISEALSYVQGKPRWFQNSLQPVHDEHGQAMYVLLHSTDIHDLKTAQQQLAELNSTLEERVRQAASEIQDLYDNAPTGYHSLDAEGRFTMINQTELNWLGYSREELIGRHFTDFLTPGSIATFFNNFPVYKQQGFIHDLEFDLIRKDGSSFPVLISSTAIKDENGNFLRSRSTMTDITARKQAEQKLQIRESYLSAMIENQPGLIWLKDIESRFLTANRAFALSCGINNPELLTGKTDADIWPSDLAQKYRNDDAEIIREGKSRIVEEPILDKGEKRWFETFKTPIFDQQGTVIGTTGFSRDITERKNAEEMLKLTNSELERAARIKDEFLANMSHELRTPLNAILGYTELLIRQFSGSLNDRQLRYVQTIDKSGRHLLELITEILDLSKLEARQMTLELAPVLVADLCESSLIFVRETASKKNIHLSGHLDPAITLIQADRLRLRQMLINLLSNAVKFTPEGGSVELHVTANSREQTVSFSVSDTGIGISEENLQRLFQPFVQIDSGLNRKYEGTGLGLTLVKRMAKLHGGSITVHSNVGKGSRFTIILPWIGVEKPHTEEENETAESAVIPVNVQEGIDAPLILVAEDQTVNLDMVSDFLEVAGYRIAVARSGVEALDQARHLRPSLILMDLQLPLMDGLEATRRLRHEADPQLANIPVIALTALAMPGDRERSLEAGANDYISKPVGLNELTRLIRKLLS